MDQNLECFLKSFKVLHVYFRKEYLKANGVFISRNSREKRSRIINIGNISKARFTVSSQGLAPKAG